jgi:glycine C-acetyltransferase
MKTHHGENFSLEHYLANAGGAFDDRFAAFRPFVDRVRGMGFVLREITSASGPVVGVRDNASGRHREVIMLGSNNYLGLADEPEIIEAAVAATRVYGVGCGGPPLLNGTTSLHNELEERLADFKNCESAMLFSSGYAANVGWLTGLMRRGDILVHDEQSHASLIDGIQLGRVRSTPFSHNDIDDLKLRLTHVRRRDADANVVVAVEGVYSMDGDIAPLPVIKEVCDDFGAWLAVDDAHGTGVLGASGRGTAEHFGMEGSAEVTMGTFSKVFATTGGFIAGSKDLVDTLRFFSRPYMFSASLAIPVVASVIAGIDYMAAHPERPRRLRDNVEYLSTALRKIGFRVQPQTAIIPIMMPEAVSVAEVVAALYADGVFVNGVEFPAVPRDQSRLRLSVMATLTTEHLDVCVQKIARVARRFGFHPDQVASQDRVGARC